MENNQPSRINQMKADINDKLKQHKEQLNILKEQHKKQLETQEIRKTGLLNAQKDDLDTLKKKYEPEVKTLKDNCLNNCPLDNSVQSLTCKKSCEMNFSL